MAVVYEGRHATLHKPVAIKVLLSNLALDPTVRERFQQEAVVQAHLAHPNIVRALDFIETPEHLAIILEWIDGPSLADVLRADVERPWTLQETRAVMNPVLAALAYSHAHQVIHRDVKPANILLERHASGQPIPRITDFGLARLLVGADPMTRVGTRMGTPPYMAPEQYFGSLGAGSGADVYAAGMLVWRLLSGTLPVDPARPASVHALYSSPRPVPALSATLPKSLTRNFGITQ